MFMMLNLWFPWLPTWGMESLGSLFFDQGAPQANGQELQCRPFPNFCWNGGPPMVPCSTTSTLAEGPTKQGPKTCLFLHANALERSGKWPRRSFYRPKPQKRGAQTRLMPTSQAVNGIGAHSGCAGPDLSGNDISHVSKPCLFPQTNRC